MADWSSKTWSDSDTWSEEQLIAAEGSYPVLGPGYCEDDGGSTACGCAPWLFLTNSGMPGWVLSQGLVESVLQHLSGPCFVSFLVLGFLSQSLNLSSLCYLPVCQLFTLGLAFLPSPWCGLCTTPACRPGGFAPVTASVLLEGLCLPLLDKLLGGYLATFSPTNRSLTVKGLIWWVIWKEHEERNKPTSENDLDGVWSMGHWAIHWAGWKTTHWAAAHLVGTILSVPAEPRLGDQWGVGVLAVAGGCHGNLTSGPWRGRS